MAARPVGRRKVCLLLVVVVVVELVVVRIFIKSHKTC